MGVTPDLNDPRYIQEVYNTLRNSGMQESQFGGGFEAAKLGAPSPGMPGGQPGSTPFDGPPMDRQTGPNTFTTTWGAPVAGMNGAMQPGLPPGSQPNPSAGWTPGVGGNSPWTTNPAVGGLGRGSMPSTYAVSGGFAGGQPYGFAPGPLPQNLLNIMRQLGFPDLGLGSALTNSTALPRFNPSMAANALGGTSIASPQSLNALGPSGTDFLMGIIEQFLGMPWGDYLYGAYQPFQGLEQGRRARTYGLGTGMPTR